MPYKRTGRPVGAPTLPRMKEPLEPQGYWRAYRSEYMQSIILAKGHVSIGDVGPAPEGARGQHYFPRDWRRKGRYVPIYANLGAAEAAELWWGPGARDAVNDLLRREAMTQSGPRAGVQRVRPELPGRSATPRASGAAAADAGAAATSKEAAE